MTYALDLRRDFSLAKLNTFGVSASASVYLPVYSDDVLFAMRSDPALSLLPRLILGGGSNMLFTRDFSGLVLHMQQRGVRIADEDGDFVYVEAAAGENWHVLVMWTLQQGFGGLENLSLIPGNVGAAPIQNIGAYGVELNEVFHSLRAFDFETGEIIVLDRVQCAFGYRDSVFKQHLRDRVVVLSVTFALPRKWVANVRYAELANELERMNCTAPTPQQVSEAIIAIRTRKLPDPAHIGNAGSFFKNPVVSRELRDALLVRFPQLVSHAQPDGQYKLAAGWLIDQCGWKGKALGKAGVYYKQALVLVNLGGATGGDIAQLAAAIQQDVRERFGVELHPEPSFI